MTLIKVENLKIEFGGDVILKNASFDVNSGDFVGLIGANGTGKTSLLKAIIGETEPTEGGVYISRLTKIGYLEQHALSGSSRTAYDEALTVFEPLMKIEKRLEEISAEIDVNERTRDVLVAEQNRLNELYQRAGGLTYASRTRSALLGLGFDENDFGLACDKLSGGQRSKLSMCKLLLSSPDVLLLDEPTNNLDVASSEWLEDFLLSFRGAALIVSHDRYFLDKTTNKTVELANGKSRSLKGGYSEYIGKRDELLESERRRYENRKSEIKRLEGIIEQQRSFARERNFITAESKRKALERKKAELFEPEPPSSKTRVKFAPVSETGDDVLTVEGISKSFGAKKLFENGDMRVFKGERVFIIGANGRGKTTFLKILTGKLPADAGFFRFGANVKIGYFDQNLENLCGGKTVLDEIWDEKRLLTETQVRNSLALFQFRGDDVFKNVDSLSGGEKAKLRLLKLVLSGANVLLLDEPTNHLDIPSREALENAFADFGGTIIAVSHDRYFINRLATKIYRMTADGFEKFDGDYDEYARSALALAKEKPKKRVESRENVYKTRKERRSEINRLNGKNVRTENEIDRLDGEIFKLNDLLSSPETAADYEKAMELTQKIERLSQKQTELMDEWERINERLSALGARAGED